MMFALHALLILGGVRLFQTEFVQNHIGQEVVRLKLANDVFHSQIQQYIAPKKMARSSTSPAVAPKEITETYEVAPATSAVSDNTRFTDLKALYKAELRAKIDQLKTYPSMSKRLGHQGEVVVGFTLLADGSIINVRIDSESRFDALNKSALATVKSVKKFKPIPKDFGVTKMDLKIPIRYLIN